MKASALATRSGVLSRPFRSGFSPRASNISVSKDCSTFHSGGPPFAVTSLIYCRPRLVIPWLAMLSLSEYRGLTHRPRILEVVVACFNQPNLFQLSGGEALH